MVPVTGIDAIVNLLIPIPLVAIVALVALMLKFEAINTGALPVRTSINALLRMRTFAFTALILHSFRNL